MKKPFQLARHQARFLHQQLVRTTLLGAGLGLFTGLPAFPHELGSAGIRRENEKGAFLPSARTEPAAYRLQPTLHHAAAITVSGQVNDEKGSGLPGVSIVIKGTMVGTTTNVEGKYTLNAPDDNGTLVFSFIGYLNQEVPIGNRTTIDVSLLPDVKTLSEVVVVGYGTQKKADLTSSISVIESEDMARAPVSSFAQAIQGLSPGVSVEMGKGAPGNGGKVRIRGVGSTNNTDPLYVIDGIPVGGVGPTNMNDIESIQVLKDAAACAIYGSRGANGVILVTTKRGKKGPLKVAGNSYFGVQQPWKQIDLLNNQEYATIMKEATTNAIAQGVTGVTTPSRVTAILNDSTGEFGPGTDWQDAIFRTAPIQEHTLSLSGGTDGITYHVSGGYFNQEGIMTNTNYERYTLRVNTDAKRGKFRFGESLGLSYGKRRNAIVSGGREILEHMVKQTPAVPIYDPNNEPGGYGGPGAADDQDSENPVLVSNMTRSYNHSFGLLGNVYGEYEFIPGLRLRTNVGLDFFPSTDFTHNLAYNEPKHSRKFNSVSEAFSNNYKILNDYTLSYDKSFGLHTVQAVIGYSQEHSKSRNFSASSEDFPNVDITAIGQGTQNFQVGGGESGWAIRSQLARVMYSYAGKYLLTANIRRDGSSRFRYYTWGNFPSVSVGWRISDERFLADSRIISDLKLRASYGALGNQNTGNYQYQYNVSLNQSYIFGATQALALGAAPTSFSNRKVRWETTYSSDFGVDLGLFDNRVSITADYYFNRTKDMLLAVPIPHSTGITSNPTLNYGGVQNKGFELSTTYQKNDGAFQYGITANFTTYKNKVLELGPENEPISAGNTEFGNVTRTEVGRAIGEFYVYKTNGLYQSQEDIDAMNINADPKLKFAPNARPGDVRFVDLNQDGLLNASDRAFVGSAIPKFEGSLRLSASFRGFDASVFMQGVSGNKIFNEMIVWTQGSHRFFNLGTAVLNRWTPENPNTNVPRVVTKDPNGNLQVSDRMVEDGSYLRMKDVTIGYTLPQNVLKKMRFSNVRFFVQAYNLLTFTKYSLYDPEVGTGATGAGGTDNTSRGIDNGIYPQARSYTGGIQFEF